MKLKLKIQGRNRVEIGSKWSKWSKQKRSKSGPNSLNLIKFIKIVLKECKSIDHELFLTSLYMLRKSLGLIDRFTQFAACQKCHKLYNKESVMSEDNSTITKCSHVEFPNSITKRSKQCQTLLGKKISLNNSISIVPELVYSVSSIQSSFLVCLSDQDLKNYCGIGLIVQ